MASPAGAATVVYVGNTESNEISVLRLDRQSGDLTLVEKVPIPGVTKPGSSTPMAVSPDRRFLYAGTRGEPKIAAGFAIDPTSGRLKHVASGPLADSLAYARFYFPLLQRIPGGPVPSPAALSRIAAADRERVDSWLEVVRGREPLGRAALTLPEVPAYALELFSRPADELLGLLQRVYDAEIPDRLLILRLDRERIASRVEGRRAGSPGSELHERAEVLAGLQEALSSGSSVLRARKPSLEITQLEVSDHSVDDTVTAVLKLTGLE